MLPFTGEKKNMHDALVRERKKYMKFVNSKNLIP